MRVLLWVELFPPYIGGAETFSANLVESLEENGHEVAVVTSHDYLDLPDTGEYRGARVYRFPFRKALTGGNVEEVFALRRRVAGLKRALAPNLIHLIGNCPSAVFHLQTVASHPAPLLMRINQEPLATRNATSSLLATLLRSASWVTPVCNTILSQVLPLAPDIGERSSVIYTGVKEPPLDPAPLPVAAPRLLCLGRVVPAKGFDLALQALASLAPRVPAVRLSIAGDGSVRNALQRQAADLGLTEIVDFIGWVPSERVPEVLNTASVVLLPSRREGLPQTAIQAALMGRPIVAARAGGLPEVVIDKETGLIVDKEDVTGLAEAIKHLLDHPEVAAEMGRAARRRAQQIFSWQRCADAYESLYKKLAS